MFSGIGEEIANGRWVGGWMDRDGDGDGDGD